MAPVLRSNGAVSTTASPTTAHHDDGGDGVSSDVTGEIAPEARPPVQRSEMELLLEHLRLQEASREALLRELLQARTNRDDGPVTRAILPDLSKEVQAFSGDGDERQAEEWLNTFNQLAAQCRWSDDSKLMLVQAKLVGPAAKWYRSKVHDCATWNAFEANFKRMFAPGVSLVSKFDDMRKRVQQKGEPILHYFMDKMHLCKRCNLSEEETKDQILLGALDRQLYQMLMPKAHACLEALLHDMKRCSQLEHERSELFGSPSTKMPQAEQKYAARAEKPKGGRYAPARDEDGRLKCYNCNEYADHLSKDCPKERRVKFCTICQQHGHGRRECEQTSRKETLCVGNPSADKYIKEATVNDRLTAKAFIDQGSAVTIITASTALRAGAVVQTASEEDALFGLGQKKTMPLGKATLKIAVDDVVATILVYIVEDQAICYDMLIGRTFIDREDVVMIKAKDQVKLFDGSKDGPFKDFQLEPAAVKPRLQSVESAEVPPNTVQFVRARTDAGPESSLVMLIHERRDPGCLLELHNGETEVPVINDSDATKVVKKGFSFGRIENVNLGSISPDALEKAHDDADDENVALTTTQGDRQPTKLEVVTVLGQDVTEEQKISTQRPQGNNQVEEVHGTIIPRTAREI